MKNADAPSCTFSVLCEIISLLPGPSAAAFRRHAIRAYVASISGTRDAEDAAIEYVGAPSDRPRKHTERVCLDVILGALIGTEKLAFDEQAFVDCSVLRDVERQSAAIDLEIHHPDVLVFLEIDEFAHSGSVNACDDVPRMHDVVAVARLRGERRPIAWVRLNPDEPGGRARGTHDAWVARSAEAVVVVRSLLEDPRDCIIYVNY